MKHKPIIIILFLLGLSCSQQIFLQSTYNITHGSSIVLNTPEDTVTPIIVGLDSTLYEWTDFGSGADFLVGQIVIDNDNNFDNQFVSFEVYSAHTGETYTVENQFQMNQSGFAHNYTEDDVGIIEVNVEEAPPECTNNTNCGDCFDMGCFWQPLAPVGYQCNYECFIIDTACYGQGEDWVAECPETEVPNCCDAAELAEENCDGLGCLIPQCTEGCEWESMQCWPSTGYCWCVDEDGNEIEGTSQPAWQGYPDCEDENFQIGDECYSADGILFGYLDCYYDCTPLEYWDWLGDGWCDEGPWRLIDFNCEELGYDCGDCNSNWDGSDPLGLCEEEIICTQGDITNDGDVNVLDVVSMVNIILQLPSENDPWDFWLCAGDYNMDGTINVLDVISLVNIILNPVSDECLIIPEVGPCDGICPTYYYNQDNGQCEEFITGCCGIEAFDTQQLCEEICE